MREWCKALPHSEIADCVVGISVVVRGAGRSLPSGVPQKTLRNAVLKILLDHPEWNIQEQERDKYCEAQSKRLKIMRRDVDQEVRSPSMNSTPTPHHAPPATTNNVTTNIRRSSKSYRKTSISCRSCTYSGSIRYK